MKILGAREVSRVWGLKDFHKRFNTDDNARAQLNDAFYMRRVILGDPGPAADKDEEILLDLSL